MRDTIKVGDKVMHNNLVCLVVGTYKNHGHYELELQPVGSSSRFSAAESDVTRIMSEGVTENCGDDFLND